MREISAGEMCKWWWWLNKGATRGGATKAAEAPSLAKSKLRKKDKLSDSFEFLCRNDLKLCD